MSSTECTHPWESVWRLVDGSTGKISWMACADCGQVLHDAPLVADPSWLARVSQRVVAEIGEPMVAAILVVYCVILFVLWTIR